MRKERTIAVGRVGAGLFTQARCLSRRALPLILLTACWMAAPCSIAAQSQPQSKATATERGAASQPVDLAQTRQQLVELVRLNPKMASLVARDPSLLGDTEYVARNNPRLAEFLQQHPEVARNPEFYLFADLGPSYQGPRLDRFQNDDQRPSAFDDLWPFLVFLVITASLLWILRVVLENRRWGRVFKVQADAHNKLLEKFGSSEELLGYMRTESGRRFLESAPIAVGVEAGLRRSSPAARVMNSLQAGIVLALAGAGLLYIRASVPEATHPLLVFGALALALGVGFTLSAGASLILARHLGLLRQDEQLPVRQDYATRS